MKVSLNSARIGKDKVTFEEMVGLAAKHGYDGIDFGMGSVIAKFGPEGASAARAWFAESQVAPASFGLDVEWRKDEETFVAGLAKLREHAAYAKAIGADRCCTWMPPAVSVDVAEWHEQSVRRFRQIADILAEGGVRFGLEWVGPHHLRADGENGMGKTNWIYDLPGTLRLIDDIGAPNVGLLVDSYHCYTTGATEADVAALPDSKIVHVHINDTAATPELAKDGERILPGTGVIDLTAFLRGLTTAGYSGYIACEILAPEAIAETCDEGAGMIREALAGLGL